MVSTNLVSGLINKEKGDKTIDSQRFDYQFYYVSVIAEKAKARYRFR
ncbi:hypothetical protein [Spirosoma sp.]